MINLFSEFKNDKYYNKVYLNNLYKDKPFDFESSLEYLVDNFCSHEFTNPRIVKIPKVGGFREIGLYSNIDTTYHKIIFDILESNIPISDKVYSYRSGIKTYDAIKNVKEYLNKDYYLIKVDISKYFNSVNKETIYKCIDNICSDYEGKDILKRIYNTYDEDGNYLSIMPGCAVSAFFANYILRDIDNKYSELCEGYFRYSDDILLVTKEDPNIILSELKEDLTKYGLTFNNKKVEVNYNPESIEFLGLRVNSNGVSIGKKTLKMLKSNIKSICKNKKSTQSKIRNILKYMYYSYSMDFKVGSIMDYIFANVTDTDCLLNIDYYIKDTIRASITGKHNKSNSVKYPTSYLLENGYLEVMDFYNAYKYNKLYYKDFLNRILNKPNIQKPDNNVYDYSEYKVEYVSNFGEYLLKNLSKYKKYSIAFRDLSYKLEDLIIDIRNSFIGFDDKHYIILNGEFNKDFILVHHHDKTLTRFEECYIDKTDIEDINFMLIGASVEMKKTLNDFNICRYPTKECSKYINLKPYISIPDFIRVNLFLLVIFFNRWCLESNDKDFKYLKCKHNIFIISDGGFNYEKSRW